MNIGIPLSWLGVWLARILGLDLSGLGERWVGASASGSASTDLHSRFRRGVWTADFPVDNTLCIILLYQRKVHPIN